MPKILFCDKLSEFAQRKSDIMKYVVASSGVDTDDLISEILEKKIGVNSTLTINTNVNSYIEIFSLNEDNEITVNTKEIKERNVQNINFSNNDISFRFYDLAMVSLKIDEDEYEITGKRRNESEMFDLSITNHEKEEVSQNKKLCKVSK